MSVARAKAAVGRIRKLLALAADQEGTPEGDAAARIARKLMHRYDLAGAQLHNHTDDPIVRHPLTVDGTILWRRRLAAAVARHCECVLSWSPGEGRAYLYGRRSGIAVAEYLHAVLRREVEGAREAFDDDLPMMVGQQKRTQRLRDFTGSAVLAIENRLKAMRCEEQSVDPDQCAVVSRRGQELNDWMAERKMRFKKQAPGIYAYDAEGYAAGHAIALHDAVRQRATEPERTLRKS